MNTQRNQHPASRGRARGFGSGWCGLASEGGDLNVPENITLLSLPPCAPELNPMENVWEYLRAVDQS
jgi:hypothetical protein